MEVKYWLLFCSQKLIENSMGMNEVSFIYFFNEEKLVNFSNTEPF